MGDARAHAARTTPLEYKCNRSSGDGFRTASLETLRGRIRDIIKESDDAVHLCLLCTSCAGRVEVYGTAPALDDGGLYRGDLGERAHVRVLAGSRPTESVVLVTISVVRDTPSDRHFSAWSCPKPAPDPLPGPSVASGVIPTKGGRNGPVPATSGRASTGRWRSSPWKRCNHAPPRGRGQGAPRTARCIKTITRGILPDGLLPSGSTPHR